MIDVKDALPVARGDAPADVLFTNGRVVNVFSGTIETTDVVVYAEHVVGLGPGYEARAVVDLDGAYLAPGLIDAHVHIESSLCVPASFASAVLPRGVTCVVTDPHEIANVAGSDGVAFMLESSRTLPLHVVVMAPSCVPATHMETSGAALPASALASLLEGGVVHGLAEVMNVPGTIHGDDEVTAKLAAFRARPRDGHAPGLSGKALNAYAVAGPGSDHECTTVEEAREKLSRGLYVFIREATNAHNLHDLLPLVTPENHRRICFCTDDRQPADLLEQGGIDYMVREAIASGIEPVTAFRMATLNTAEWFGLHDRGAVAPGRVADFVIFDDLNAPTARQVYARGELVGEDGRMHPSVDLNVPAPLASVRSSVNVDWDAVDFRIPARGRRVRVIGALENQLITETRVLEATVEDGEAVADPDRDVLKVAVIERHRASGAMGRGFVQGFGLQRGALAGTVAHDHHNLIVIGADDVSMRTAARAVGEMEGGLVVADGDAVLAALPLPVAGLMSGRPIEDVRAGYGDLLDAASALGSALHDPLMAMSFMGLEVIPTLKLTDQGLVDVERFEVVPLFV